MLTISELNLTLQTIYTTNEVLLNRNYVCMLERKPATKNKQQNKKKTCQNRWSLVQMPGLDHERLFSYFENRGVLVTIRAPGYRKFNLQKF